MEPLEFLRSTIADFPGYGNDDARRRSDELVRSYLGEAVAGLEARLEVSGDTPLQRRIGDVLLRVAFANQAAYKIYENAARANPDFDAMAAADARTVEVASRAGNTDAAQLSAYLDEVAGALDNRDAAMNGTVTAPAAAPAS